MKKNIKKAISSDNSIVSENSVEDKTFEYVEKLEDLPSALMQINLEISKKEIQSKNSSNNFNSVNNKNLRRTSAQNSKFIISNNDNNKSITLLHNNSDYIFKLIFLKKIVQQDFFDFCLNNVNLELLFIILNSLAYIVGFILYIILKENYFISVNRFIFPIILFVEIIFFKKMLKKSSFFCQYFQFILNCIQVLVNCIVLFFYIDSKNKELLYFENLFIFLIQIYSGCMFFVHSFILSFIYLFLFIIWIGKKGNDEISIKNIILTIFFILFILIIKYLKNKFILKDYYKHNENIEKYQKQEELLMHLLPSYILDKFLFNPQEIMDFVDIHDDVTILFADIVNFTQYSSKVDSSRVVNVLRGLFTEFDKLCLVHNVYKIYTIGDCYVVISMTNNQKRDQFLEVKNVVYFANDMLEAINKVKIQFNCHEIDMRIGIHTVIINLLLFYLKGTIIGGIIGTDIVRYDIYGKDVLIANLMESNGIKGHIIVSEKTKQLIESKFNEFIFEIHKTVHISSINSDIESFIVYPVF